MMSTKPSILLAEDSSLGLTMLDYLSDKYNIDLARNGREVIECINKGKTYDVCIIDIIMPVEELEFSIEDSQETGIRLISKIISSGTSFRFLVLTVRKDVENKVKEIIGNNGIYTFLLKISTDSIEIEDSIKNLLNNKFRPQIPIQTEWNSNLVSNYNDILTIIGEGELVIDELYALLASIHQILKRPPRKFKNDEQVRSILSQIYMTLKFRLCGFKNDQIKGVANAICGEIEEINFKNKIF
jgi:DNA-binding NtrC family response regulator